jgi:hypothetical protein
MDRKISFPILTKVRGALPISYLEPFAQKHSTIDERSSPVRLRYTNHKVKHIFVLLLSMLAISAYGQDKYNYFYGNSLMELKGTEYVLLKVGTWSKMSTVQSQYLLFINTENGQSKRIDFPKGSKIEYEEQVKIDSLKINKVMVVASTVNLDNSKRIDWSDPTQIILFSADGQEIMQLTDDNFFLRTWRINNTTGKIVVTGHYDTNDNGKYDKTDEYEILLYDLKTAKLVARVSQ